MAWLRRSGDAPPAGLYVLFRYLACGRHYNARGSRHSFLIPHSSFLILPAKAPFAAILNSYSIYSVLLV